MVCNRAATLTTSPIAVYSVVPATVPTTTSPVFTPMRRCNGPSMSTCAWTNWSSVSCSWSAARIARSASSSCAIGAPNSARMASPSTLSIVPPNDSMSTIRRWKAASIETLQPFRIEMLRQARVADDVGEQDGDDASLLGRRGDDLVPAERAEARTVGQRPQTRRAGATGRHSALIVRQQGARPEREFSENSARADGVGR